MSAEEAPLPAVAYLVSRFPKLSETFILREMEAMEAMGLRLELFPLRMTPGGVTHTAAAAWTRRARPAGWPGAPMAALRYWSRRAPAAYRRLWREVVVGNWGHPGFFIRALAVVPAAAACARQLGALGVGHVHAHWATHPALAAYCIHTLTGLPYSLTIHAHDLYVRRPMLARKLAHATAIVTISEYNRNLLGRLYGAALRDKVHVIHCGVPVDVFHPARRRAPAGLPVVLCVGSLEPKKGHAVLLEACRLLRDGGTNFACVLVGGGKLQRELSALTRRLGLEGIVRFAGPLPQEGVLAHLATASVAVQPSVVLRTGKTEGIPVSLMEAMAMEVPVVASDISGIPELVAHEESGLLVPQQDPAALAAAIRRVLMDPALARRLGQAGRLKVLSEFDLSRTTAQLKARLVASLAGGRTGGGAS